MNCFEIRKSVLDFISGLSSTEEFRFIALLPFTVITSIGILLIVLSGFEWTVILLGFIITHAACCGGDFGLLSYMYEHRDEEMITIDDMEKGETYFLVKNKEIQKSLP